MVARRGRAARIDHPNRAVPGHHRVVSTARISCKVPARWQRLDAARAPVSAGTTDFGWPGRAADLRDGALAWWREAHGAPGRSAALPEYPFEVRCRVYPQKTPGYVD